LRVRAGAFALTLLVAQVASAETRGDQLHGYRVVRKQRKPLIITGAALLAGGYLGAALVAWASSFQGISPVMFVPIAGPFIGLVYDATTKQVCPLGASYSQNCNGVGIDPWMGFVGGLQVLGGAMLAVGLVPHEVKVRTVMPTFSFDHGPGIGLRGTF
jgi:hypothetical protein